MRKAFPVLLLLLLACGQASAQERGAGGPEPETRGLVIRGEVTGVEVERDKDSVKFYVRLNVEFVNEGAETIILFGPSTYASDMPGERYWLGGWTLYANEAEAKSGRAIFGDGYWESVMGSDYYRDLAYSLDVKTPPESHTKLLGPKESWKFPDSFRIYFEAETHQRWPEKKTWQEMQAYPSPLWLRIHYELSPWNVEFFKPDLIRRLAKRWRKFGNVLVEKKKEGRFNHFHAASEPMPIDLSQAKPKAAATELREGR